MNKANHSEWREEQCNTFFLSQYYIDLIQHHFLCTVSCFIEYSRQIHDVSSLFPLMLNCSSLLLPDVRMGPVLQPDIFILSRKNVISSLHGLVQFCQLCTKILLIFSLCTLYALLALRMKSMLFSQQCAFGAGIGVCVYIGRVLGKQLFFCCAICCVTCICRLRLNLFQSGNMVSTSFLLKSLNT